MTWAFAIAFIITSLTLTIIAAQKAGGNSVLDRLGIETPVTEEGDIPSGDMLLTPSAGEGDDGLLPRLDE